MGYARRLGDVTDASAVPQQDADDLATVQAWVSDTKSRGGRVSRDGNGNLIAVWSGPGTSDPSGPWTSTLAPADVRAADTRLTDVHPSLLDTVAQAIVTAENAILDEVWVENATIANAARRAGDAATRAAGAAVAPFEIGAVLLGVGAVLGLVLVLDRK